MIDAVVLRTGVATIAAAIALTAAGEQPLPDVPRLNFGQPLPQYRLQWPGYSGMMSPGLVAPTISNYRLPQPLRLRDGLMGSWADSLAAMPATMHVSAQARPAAQHGDYDFDRNPYSHDWQASGVIARLGDGQLGGSGSRASFPALGNVATGSLWVTQTVYERLTLTAGITGSKYHFGREAWNDYGVWGRASYQINGTLSLNAFGQYNFNPHYHSMGAMGITQNSNYGATLGVKVSDNFSVDVGAQRYYDVYAHCWRTIPILAPTVRVLGQPLSVDVGGILYGLLKSLGGGHGGGYRLEPSGGGGMAVPQAPFTDSGCGLARDNVPHRH